MPLGSSCQELTSSEEQHRQNLAVQGYTILKSVMSPAQLAAGRAALDALNRHLVPVQNAYQQVNLTNHAEVFRELAQQPDLLALVDGILGSDCILSGVNQRSSLPGAPPQPIHRDMNIWGPAMFWMPEPIGLNVGWAFDDFTAENATQVVPGSHLRPEASASEPTIPLCAPAGSFLVMDARLLHRAGPNRTQQVRRAVFTFYVRSWLKPQTDHKRSTDPEVIRRASPTLIRLLGFQRQSPVETPTGESVIVPAPGATYFYGQKHGQNPKD